MDRKLLDAEMIAGVRATRFADPGVACDPADFASGASHAAGGGDHDAEGGSLVLHRAVQVADVGR